MIVDMVNYNKIHDFLDKIKVHPKRDVKYFFIDDGKKFIVMGDKLKSLPLTYHAYYTKDEFYIHVDAINKTIQYYAFDIKDYNSGERINEATGTMPWSKEIEECIYNFFALNIKELSSSTFPYSGAGNYQQPPYHSNALPPYKPPMWQNESYSGYGSSTYKDREAFCDKINDLLKQCKTAQATDYIIDNLNKMKEDKKLTTIDDILRLISFDKLNIATMLTILETTKSIEGLKDRGFFFDKVKTHLVKLKQSRVDMVLKRVM